MISLNCSVARFHHHNLFSMIARLTLPTLPRLAPATGRTVGARTQVVRSITPPLTRVLTTKSQVQAVPSMRPHADPMPPAPRGPKLELAPAPLGGQNEQTTFHAGRGEPTIHGLFHGPTSTWTYVVVGRDEETCVVIDPVLDYDAGKQVIGTESADALMSLMQGRGYRVSRILETHAHADHLTGAHYLRSQLFERGLAATRGPVPVCIGAGIAEVQARFGPRYGLSPHAGDFDILFRSGPSPIGSPHGATDSFTFGGTSCAVLHLPGHTPDHAGYLIGRHLFCGDVIFLPDVGSARADFPGGSAENLYTSLQTVLALPDDTQVYVGHDYPPSGRGPQDRTTVGQERSLNIHLQGLGCPRLVGNDEVEPACRQQQFLDLRRARDKTLSAPRLLHPSLQVNIRGGRLPPGGFFRMPFERPDVASF